ncbi:hypothetical protein [Halobaculum magnesiiphilum]|uniref:Uncharacterized protein n=1 Tax=Halobaculum magnesiiphilum TaxID=1017351 RepID=A0A8T8WFQ7_9EURY|nr:hypothetical protein [Halobaculum magnesiiphilum]QZP38574.1 hypothetical protein K6T50_05385 [Halobaculum magnesiiphilum]
MGSKVFVPESAVGGGAVGGDAVGGDDVDADDADDGNDAGDKRERGKSVAASPTKANRPYAGAPLLGV